MTEEGQKRISELIDIPSVKRALVYQMISSHKGGIYLNTPESDGFPANRFEGRLTGYMYALVCDRIKPKEEVPVNTETVLPYATEEEICVFEKVQQKIKEQNDKDILPFDDGHVGLCEGMAIYINKEDISLLYSEVDIDLNKNCDDDGIPSYAYYRSVKKATLLFAIDNKSKQEVLDTLKADGLVGEGASLIVKEVVTSIRSQRIKGAITTFFKGLAFLIVGLVITGISLLLAVAWGEERFIVTYGFMAVGGIYMVVALVSFIKALCFKRRK